MTYFIPIVGTHCSGKTTLAEKLTNLAQKKGYNAMFISEVARDCPFPMHEGQTEEATQWILEEQKKREDALKNLGLDVVFCDRSFADPLLYFFAKKENKPTLNQFLLENKKAFGKTLYKTSIEYTERYNYTIFQELSEEELLLVEDDGFRNTNLVYRKEIQNIASKIFAWLTDCLFINPKPLTRQANDENHLSMMLDVVLYNFEPKCRKDSNPSECLC